MLTPEEIKSITGSGEGYNVDFKLKVPSKVKELSQDVCAFANSEGGYILIGIDNNDRIVGTAIDNSKRSAIQDAIRDISPVIKIDMYAVDVEGKTVWVMDVPSGKDKPYVTSGAIYIREGCNSQKLTTAEEIRNFFQSSNRIYFDAVPCPRYDIEQELDEENFNTFRLESGMSGNVSTHQTLDNLQVFDDSGVIKNGGVLFFGKKPEKLLPHAVVRCVSFKGTNKVHIIDDKTYGGTLYNQYIQAESWIKDKLKVTYIIEGTGPRKEIWEIPLTVFKESIINALSHRDYYEQGAVTMVEIYDDRVEISNPGGLLMGVKKDFGKKSMSRNPLIFGLFTRMNLVEKLASGIPRMQEDMKKAGLPEPVFTTDEAFFTVEFKRPKDNYPINLEDGTINPDNGTINLEDGTINPDDGTINGTINPDDGTINFEIPIEDIIFKLISDTAGLSARDISKLIDKSLRTTMRYINILKKENRIEYRGALKNGGYYLKNQFCSEFHSK
ncbi:ArsR family transcriptional regulator [Bacteroidia bacterium]|nr:ArsR family transcriptional regulator [Bacteroidia bacterium]